MNSKRLLCFIKQIIINYVDFFSHFEGTINKKKPKWQLLYYYLERI